MGIGGWAGSMEDELDVPVSRSTLAGAPMTGVPEDRRAAAPEAGTRPTDDWLPLVYQCLHQLAETALRSEARGHTLQPTALVHEAYVRLRTSRSGTWNDQVHFLAVASRVLREVLVDHARRKRAAKRGGGWGRITLDHVDAAPDGHVLDLLDLEDALEQLGRDHERAAYVVELRYFGGLTIPEIAAELSVSSRTIDQDWHFARAWLIRALDDGP